MHPFHIISLAHEHVADLQSNARRRGLVRRARRGGGARSPAPPQSADAAPLRFLGEPDERRPTN